MKKQIAIIILTILLLASVIQDVSAATTVFLTSDNIMGTNDDADMLNSIKTYIEEINNGKINVIVDSNPQDLEKEQELLKLIQMLV